jgi:transcriptional regulator with XRE-family HTH domain
MDSSESLGLALRVLRAARGLTQTKLAKEAHLTKGQLSGYESGKKAPRYATLMRLLAILNVTLASLDRAQMLVLRLEDREGDEGEEVFEPPAGPLRPSPPNREEMKAGAARFAERVALAFTELLDGEPE